MPEASTRVTEMLEFINQHIGIFLTDVSSVKIVFPETAIPEQDLTYTVVVYNLGTVTATGVTVTDLLPVTLEPVSATSTQGNCAGHQTVTCNLDDIAVFQMLQLR